MTVVSDYLKHLRFDRLLSGSEQSSKAFDSLEDQSQALAILREYRTSGKLLKASLSNALAGIVELMLRCGIDKRNPQDLANECYKRIQDWLTERFFSLSLTEPIIGYPLIPACRRGDARVKNLFHCEARFASTVDGRGRILARMVPPKPRCPRMKVYCMERHEDQPKTTYARIVPRQSLSWSDWSLFELCEVAGIRNAHLERAFGTRAGEGDEAITRLAGGINRLNEIRERLACRACSRRLDFGHKFTVMDACYRATVTLPCECGQPSVYFNHCKGCGDIIDSRDSRLKDENNYYICINCASGEEVEEAGAKCPKCGAQDSLRGPWRKKTCEEQKCGHEVELPLRARRTKVSTSS